MTNKKILFTGGNGFIGRQIIPFIQEAGYEVVHLDQLRFVLRR